MRKIEQQMIAAIKRNDNWSSGNTEVVTNQFLSTVYLHGNKIALVDDVSVTLFDGGYKSNTTKSRLNAILSEFGYTCGTKCEQVYAKDFLWYVSRWNEEAQEIEQVEFKNGLQLI